MFSARLSLSGDTDRTPFHVSQLVTLLNGASFRLPVDDIKAVSIEDPSSVGIEELNFEINMDPSSDKYGEARLVPMPQFLVNNPNISIIPARSSQSPSTSPKSPISSVSRVSRVSPPVSVVPVTVPLSVASGSQEHTINQDQSTSKSTDSKDTRSNFKRNAPNTIADRPFKVPRVSVPRLSKKSKEKSAESILSDKTSKPNQSNIVNINTQPKKTDSPSKQTNLNIISSTSSTSSFINRVPQQTTSQQPPKQTSNLDLNHKVDSSVEVEKSTNETYKKYKILPDGQIKLDHISKKLDPISKNKPVEIWTNGGEVYEIHQPELITHVLSAVGAVLKKNLTKDGLDSLKLQRSDIVRSPEHDRSNDTKDVSAANVSLSLLNQNNHISILKNQSTSQVGAKSQRITTNNHLLVGNQQHSSTSKHPTTKLSPVPLNDKPVISTNLPSKVQSNRQTNSKKRVSDVQNSTSLKHSMATVPQIVNVAKQLVYHQPSTSKLTVALTPQIPSTSKPVINQTSGKSQTILPQPSLESIKLCSKCKNKLDDNDKCTTCSLSSQFKGVTVTRIETPGTPNKSDKSDSVILLDSSDEDEKKSDKKTASFEPDITKVESNDLISKHLDKIKANSKLLDDRLWQKDIVLRDVFHIECCHSIRIGTFITSPATPGEIFVSLHGIRMTINDEDYRPMTIDVTMDNIVKILAFYGEPNPTLFIYTNYLASVGIRYLLNMTENNKDQYYDPVSKDYAQKKIVWSFDLNDYSPLERLLQKLPKEKYSVLTIAQAHEMLDKLCMKTEDKKSVKNVEKVDKDGNVELVSFASESSVSRINITSYKGLSKGVYFNDALIEFYLNYWFTCDLPKKDKDRTYIFSPFFYSRLKDNRGDKTGVSRSRRRHERVKKWTKNVNIFEKDFVVVPICEDLHWFVAVICFPYLKGPVSMIDGTPIDPSTNNINFPEPHGGNRYASPIDDPYSDDVNVEHEDFRYYNVDVPVSGSYEEEVERIKAQNRHPIKQPCILIFDSLSAHANRGPKVVATLREYLHEEYRAKYPGEERSFSKYVMKGHTVKVPQQPNYVDCGLYSLHYVENFFSKPIVDYNCPILHLANWFPNSEVVGGHRKRVYIHQIVSNLMKKQNRKLPPGVEVPELDFSETLDTNESSTDNQNPNQLPTQQQSVLHNRHQRLQNIQRLNSSEVSKNGLVNDYYQEEEDEDVPDDWDYENVQPDDDDIDDEDCDDSDSQDEGIIESREYYGDDIGENDEWVENNPNDGEFYEQGYDENEINNYEIHPDNGIVDVDELEAPGPSNHRRNHAYGRNATAKNYRPFRASHHQSHMNIIDDDDDDDDDEEYEDD